VNLSFHDYELRGGREIEAQPDSCTQQLLYMCSTPFHAFVFVLSFHFVVATKNKGKCTNQINQVWLLSFKPKLLGENNSFLFVAKHLFFFDSFWFCLAHFVFSGAFDCPEVYLPAGQVWLDICRGQKSYGKFAPCSFA
jgi:hypothetical protein